MTAFCVALPFVELRLSSLSGASQATVTADSWLMPASSVSASLAVPPHAVSTNATEATAAVTALVRLMFNVPPQGDGDSLAPKERAG
ncbi:hypothetical protein D3C74_309300 [compost metagenome]